MRIAAALSTLLLPAALLACGSKAPEQQGAAPAAGDSLVIASGSDPEHFISFVSQSAADSDIIGNIFFPLVDSDFNLETGSIEYKPALATEWSWSEDGTVLKMKLRTDIKWQDGTPLSAQDVVWTIEATCDPRSASPRLAYCEKLVPGKRPLVIDPANIEFHFTEAYEKNTMISNVAAVEPMPSHLLKGVELSAMRGHDFDKSASIVTGRWKIGKWDKGSRVVLVPNDQWSGPAEEKPKLRQVIFRNLPDYQSRLVELQTGGVDHMQGVLVADADKLAKEHPEIKLVRRGWRSMSYIGWNNIDPADYKARKDAAQEKLKAELARIDGLSIPEADKAAQKAEAEKNSIVDPREVKAHPLFGDKRVRVALGKAINTNKIREDLLSSKVTGEKYARPCVGTLSPALKQIHADEITPLAHDPAGAKAELAALGWTDSDGDGWLDKDGKPFRFSLVVNQESALRDKVSVIVQSNLKEIGVDMQIEKVAFAALSERNRNKDFDASLAGWSAGLFPDPRSMWHSGPDHQFNYVSYSNPKADELMTQALKFTTTAESASTWKELQKVIYDDQPYAFLFWMDEIVAVHSRFEDTTVDILSPYRDLHEWSVPADKIKYK
jgi:peptide/nickel transport system substrate-binding protein